MKISITKIPFFYIAGVFIIIAMILSGFISISKTESSITIGFKSQIVEHDAVVSSIGKLIGVENISKSELNKSFEKYLEEKKDNSDRWLTWMSILSTIFAVFFVYSGFKINDSVEKYTEILNEMRNQRKSWDQEHQFMQLLFKVNTWRMKSEYENALDLLDDILRKEFVQTDDDKKYTIHREIADTHYQIGESSERNKENSANYQNAILSQKRALKIKPDGEDDLLFLKELENKYNEMDQLSMKE